MDKHPYVLILGSGELAHEFANRRRLVKSSPCKLLGRVSLNGNGHHPPEQANGLPILGNAKTLSDYIFHNPVDIVMVSSSLSSTLSRELLEPALEIGLSVAIPKDVSVCLDPAVKKKLFTRRVALFGVDTTLLSTVPATKRVFGPKARNGLRDCGNRAGSPGARIFPYRAGH
jgi:hypothetical protein